MIAPLFLGLIADRFFPSQIVMGVLFLIGGILLMIVPTVLVSEDGGLMVTLLILNMICFMPTLGLANSIAFANLDRLTFPKVRVWGTIGWIVAGLVVGILGWSAKFEMFYLGGVSLDFAGTFFFFTPQHPRTSKRKAHKPTRSFDGRRIWSTKKPAFAVFMICSMLICIPLAYYYGTMSNYLGNTGFLQPASTMTIGQMSEIFFMILIPFFFRKLGVKWMILIGMLAWFYDMFYLLSEHRNKFNG